MYTYMSTRIPKTCIVCNRGFNRTQRLLDHISRTPDCALDMRTIQWLQEGDHKGVLLDIHQRHCHLTNQTLHSHKYRETRKILIQVYTHEQDRLSTVNEATIQGLQAKISELEAYNKALLEASYVQDTTIQGLLAGIYELESENKVLREVSNVAENT